MTGWNTFSVSANLSAGSVYHLVIQYESGIIDASNCITLPSTMPKHGFIPFDQFQDASINALQYNGSAWTTEERMPIFIIGFSDAGYYGNAYFGSTTNRFIYGAGGAATDDVEQAELFVAPESMNVNRIGFLGRRIGTPADRKSVV